MARSNFDTGGKLRKIFCCVIFGRVAKRGTVLSSMQRDFFAKSRTVADLRHRIGN